jgi:hypothetical protein
MNRSQIILKVFFRKYCRFQYENTLSIIRKSIVLYDSYVEVNFYCVISIILQVLIL